MLRFMQILYVFALHLLFYRLSPSLQHKSFGERLREALERLGLVFIKIGQFLAARGWTELESLWDGCEPLPFGVIKPIVECELGRPIEQCFDSFETQAYASASIAQTYVAFWHGRKAIVKVVRPNVLGSLRQDMCIARVGLWLGTRFSSRLRRFVRSTRVLEQIESWLKAESDMRNEKANAEHFRAGYDTDKLVVPKVWFASRFVLVEEFLEGIPANRWKEEYRAQGYDPQASIRNFLPATFGPPFRGIPVDVHADPHPANMIIMQDGKIGMVDYGRVGRVSKRDLDMLNRAVFAVYTQNTKRTVEALLKSTRYRFKSRAEHAAFERDIEDYVEECQQQPFDFWLLELGRILARHGVPTLDTLTLIACFGVLGNKVTQMFFPNSSTIDLVGAEIKAGMEHQFGERIRNIKVLPVVHELVCRLEELPTEVADTIHEPIQKLRGLLDDLFGPVQTKSA